MIVRSVQISLLFPLLLTASGVAANSVKELVVTSNDSFDSAPVISVVSSDGEAYDTVDTTNTSTVEVGLRAQCRFGATRKKQPYQGTLRVPGFVQVGATSPRNEELHKATRARAKFKFVDGAGQPTSAPEICETELANRLKQQPGKSKYELMTDGFSVQTPDALLASYTLSCLPTGFGRQDSQSQSVRINATINCLPSDLAAAYIPSGEMTITQIDVTPMITSTSLVALPNQYSGACPTQIKFAGFITASRAGEIRYRYVDQNGQASPHEHLVFNEAGRLPTRELQRVITLNPPADESIVDQSGASDKVGASTIQAPADTTPSSLIEGAVRIEILAPTALESDIATFIVDCTSIAETQP